MEKDKPNSVSRRSFIGRMAGGVIGASLIAKGAASAARLSDSDFDLDVRLSPAKPSEQKVAGKLTIDVSDTCTITCYNTCGTCGNTCQDTCSHSCYATFCTE